MTDRVTVLGVKAAAKAEEEDNVFAEDVSNLPIWDLLPNPISPIYPIYPLLPLQLRLPHFPPTDFCLLDPYLAPHYHPKVLSEDGFPIGMFYLCHVIKSS